MQLEFSITQIYALIWSAAAAEFLFEINASSFHVLFYDYDMCGVCTVGICIRLHYILYNNGNDLAHGLVLVRG